MARKGTIRRVYSRMKRRVSRSKGTVMGPLALAALGGGIAATGNDGKIQYAGSPAGYLVEQKWADAGVAAMRNLATPQTYIPLGAVLVVWALEKAVGVAGKKVTKHRTLG